MQAVHPPEFDLAAFHVARSQYIDAYNRIEEALRARLWANGIDPGYRSAGQKIEALRAVKPSPRYSKNEHKRVHEVLARLEAENEIRRDVVHSPLRIVWVDGESLACFINPQRPGSTTTEARLVSASQFEDLCERLLAIASELGAATG